MLSLLHFCINPGFWIFCNQKICTCMYIGRRQRKVIAQWKRGSPLYTLLMFFVYDSRKRKARIAKIIKFWNLENRQNLLKSRNAMSRTPEVPKSRSPELLNSQNPKVLNSQRLEFPRFPKSRGPEVPKSWRPEVPKDLGNSEPRDFRPWDVRTSSPRDSADRKAWVLDVSKFWKYLLFEAFDDVEDFSILRRQRKDIAQWKLGICPYTFFVCSWLT